MKAYQIAMFFVTISKLYNVIILMETISVKNLLCFSNFISHLIFPRYELRQAQYFVFSLGLLEKFNQRIRKSSISLYIVTFSPFSFIEKINLDVCYKKLIKIRIIIITALLMPLVLGEKEFSASSNYDLKEQIIANYHTSSI